MKIVAIYITTFIICTYHSLKLESGYEHHTTIGTMATQPVVADEKVGHEHEVSSQDLSESGSGHTPTETLVAESPKRTWRSYVWDTFDKSPEERRFLFKLDAVILTFASLGYFIKYLDQVNVNNAYVSGMKEDMGFFGNELNYMTTCWTVGYVIGEIPR